MIHLVVHELCGSEQKKKKKKKKGARCHSKQ
jgi:hypothetical protein